MFSKDKYIKRLIDEQLSTYLQAFGAVLIDGPKWCGKTWTATNSSNSSIILDDENIYQSILIDKNFIFNQDVYKHPLLIDEWQLIPSLWDAVRRECDRLDSYGNFILTGSTLTLSKNDKSKIFHSGAGRIAKLTMYPMSLYEMGVSTNEISIIDMFNDVKVYKRLESSFNLKQIAQLIIKGGWPESVKLTDENLFILKPQQYLESLITNDIKDFNKKSYQRMKMIIHSLARNESTVVSENTILRDINESNKNVATSSNTLYKYLDTLRNLNILVEENVFDANYRSSKKVGKWTKKHLVDPSLSCAALNLNSNKLLNDLRTMGFMFEGLVMRDLRIYANYLNANLYHFRDNSSGLEIDAIFELDDSYGAIEIKLGGNGIEQAVKNLVKFRTNVNPKPKFLCVIVGVLDYMGYDSENDIYVIPFSSLKPK